ncbi:MAG: hypothetical protein ACTSUV_02440 [Candidatus Ranarchaeia archaeon]
MKTKLPIKKNPKTTYILSIASAIIMATVSILGLLYPNIFYPTQEILQSFFTNDVVNLFIGLPILLGSMLLTKQNKLIGLLFWPGAQLYILYNYIAYVFAIPLSTITIAYAALVLLSTYCTIDLFNQIDKKAVQEKLAQKAPVKISGVVLVALGTLFIFRALGIIIPAIMSSTMIPLTEMSVLIADIVISLLFIIGGVLLLKKKAFGYVTGLGLLFVGSMLFIGLIMVLLLQPVLTGTPLVLLDVIIVSLMGLICFIPFGLFTHKVITS